MKLVTKVHQIDFHRNGVSGAPFYIVLFDSPDEDCPDRVRKMVATIFPNPDETGDEEKIGRTPYCAVYDVDLLAKGIATFGENSFRGDCFEAELRPFVNEHIAKSDERFMALVTTSSLYSE